jgi:hypothetical protein
MNDLSFCPGPSGVRRRLSACGNDWRSWPTRRWRRWQTAGERVELNQLLALLMHTLLFGGAYAVAVERAASRYV